MKKILLCVLILIPFYGSSQQILKRIKNTATHTVVEYFALANGTSPDNFIGNTEFLEVEHLSYFGAISFESESGTLQASDTIYPNHNIENISFCNETFQNNTVIYNIHSNYKNSINTVYLNISTIETIIEGDALSDTNFGNDLLYYKVEIPKLLDDGNPVPLNTQANVLTPQGFLSSTTFINNFTFFKFDGTNWIMVPEGLQNLCETLSVHEMKNLENKNSIYPNPATHFITITNNGIKAEDFEYIILDLNGRILERKNSKFNKINIEHLTSGSYVIQIQTKNGQMIVEKLIKN